MPGIQDSYAARIGNFDRVRQQNQTRGCPENIPLRPGRDAAIPMQGDFDRSLTDVRNGNPARPLCGTPQVVSGRTVAKTLVGITAVLVVGGVVAGTIYNSPSHAETALSPHRPDMPPTPQPLIMASTSASTDNETVVGVCRRVIGEFSKLSRVSTDSVTLAELDAIKAKTAKIVCLAQNMVLDETISSSELNRAAQCSGVDLRKNKVQVMISSLEAKKSALLEEGAISIDMANNILTTNAQVRAINGRIAVLQAISNDLHNATVTLNAKILQNIG